MFSGINSEVRYRLLDDAEGHFRMDNSMDGIVLLSKPLDRERIDLLSAVVEATDTGVPNLSSTTRLVVNVAG